MIDPKLVAIAIFILCYFLVLMRKFNIAWIAVGSAFTMVFLEVITLGDVGSILWTNWEIIAIYWGIMVLSIAFFESRMPDYLAIKMLKYVHTVRGTIIALCLLSAFISAFVENIAVILLMAPIAISIAKRIKHSVFPFLVSIAISSNLEGTLTLIGDPPAIIVGMKTGLTFLDFFWFQGKPGISLFVLAATVTAFITLWILFRKEQRAIRVEAEDITVSWTATIAFILTIIAVAVFPYWGIPIGWVGIAAGMISFMILGEKMKRGFQEFNWQSFFFIIAVFIIVGALEHIGLIADIADWVQRGSFASPFIAFALITWVSVLISGFVDNIPFVALMVPVTETVAQSFGDPNLRWVLLFGMLIGSTVGGNITPVGAGANIVAAGLIEKHGEKVRLWDYMKIGLPFTIVGVMTAFILIWVVWM